MLYAARRQLRASLFFRPSELRSSSSPRLRAGPLRYRPRLARVYRKVCPKLVAFLAAKLFLFHLSGNSVVTGIGIIWLLLDAGVTDGT